MDNMQSGGMEQQDSQQGGYCIEIYVGADGRPTSVNVETMDDENSEEQGGDIQGQMGADQGDMGEGQDDDKGVPVASLEDAMSMVKQIIQNQGQMPPDQGTAQDQMMQGYGQGGIGAKRGGLPVRKVFSGGM
jgi:hypothetical protein